MDYWRTCSKWRLVWQKSQMQARPRVFSLRSPCSLCLCLIFPQLSSCVFCLYVCYIYMATSVESWWESLTPHKSSSFGRSLKMQVNPHAAANIKVIQENLSKMLCSVYLFGRGLTSSRWTRSLILFGNTFYQLTLDGFFITKLASSAIHWHWKILACSFMNQIASDAQIVFDRRAKTCQKNEPWHMLKLNHIGESKKEGSQVTNQELLPLAKSFCLYPVSLLPKGYCLLRSRAWAVGSWAVGSLQLKFGKDAGFL